MAELSKRDKQRIRKHVTNCCANYSKEYGCLPLETVERVRKHRANKAEM